MLIKYSNFSRIYSLYEPWASLCTHKPHQCERPPAWRGHAVIWTPFSFLLHTPFVRQGLEAWKLYLMGSLTIPSLGFTTESYARRKRWKRSRHHYSFDSDGCSLNFGWEQIGDTSADARHSAIHLLKCGEQWTHLQWFLETVMARFPGSQKWVCLSSDHAGFAVICKQLMSTSDTILFGVFRVFTGFFFFSSLTENWLGHHLWTKPNVAN